MKILLLTFLCFCIISCSSKNKEVFSINDAEVPPGYALIEYSPIEDEVQEILDYSGIQVFSKYNIKLNTDNPNYFFFLATFDLLLNENGGASSSDIKLNSLETSGGCFIWKLTQNRDSSFYQTEVLNKQFVIDKRMGKILGTDSLYYSTNGHNYKAFPHPFYISSYPTPEHKVKRFNLDKPVPLFVASIKNPAITEENSMSHLIYGMISYDCQKPYDLDSLFNSNSFASLVWMYDEVDKIDALNLDNYLKE